MIVGEKGADRCNGRGPCTVHVSFRPQVEREESVGFAAFGSDGWDSSSRYAEPDADGVTPVFRTVHVSL